MRRSPANETVWEEYHVTTRRSVLTCSAVALGALVLPRGASAQAFPSKPVKIIVPFPPGGPADTAVRAVQPGMEKLLGQPIIIENMGGAAGSIGLNRVKQAEPDGYTLIQAASPHTTTAAVKPGSIDLLRDFAPIGQTGNSTFTLVVSPSLGVQTLAELIARAKSKPGELKFGSVGNGSSQHLVAEMLIAATKIELTHVPYRGEAPSVPDLVTGRVDLMFMASAKQYIDGGQVIGIGVTAAEPWFNLPGIKPLSQQGLTGFVVDGWNGLMAPKATPPAVVAKLSDALSAALKADGAVRAFDAMGFKPGDGRPGPMAKQIEDDMRIFTTVIRERNLKFDT
jgi:tripartite-type tricarboxylate transporter receptor subunit TctC